MRFSRLGAGLGAGALAVAGLTVAAPAAQASSGLCSPGCAASVEFHSRGERFVVHDYARDGHATVAVIWEEVSDGWIQYPPATNHYGYDGPPATFDYGIDEGTRIAYRACLSEQGEIFSCSGLQYDHA